MTYWIHDLSPFLWEIAPGIGLRWYGVAYAAGFLVGWWLLIQLVKAQAFELSAKARQDFIFALILGVVIGGRLGYMLLYDTARFFGNSLTFFNFWEGGMASHGGMLGVALACFIFAKKEKIKALSLIDAVCVMAPAGLLFGRLANFINGELWGKIATVPWAVVFPKSAAAGTPVDLIAPRHPSQLYEAALEGVLLLIYTQLRTRAGVFKKPGQMTGEFIILYALVRCVCELFREPDAALIMGVSRGIFYSLLIIPLGVGFIIAARKAK